MAAQTDMQALDKMFNDLNKRRGGGGGGGDISWFKPNPPKADGSAGAAKRVRILPQGENNNHIFFSHVMKHFNLSEKPFTCPKTHNEECEVCEKSWEFWKEAKNTEHSKEVQENLRKIWTLSKNRDTHYLALLDREDKGEKLPSGEYEFPNGRPKVWSFSSPVRQQLGQIMCPEVTEGEAAPEFFDITSLDGGIDLNVSKAINPKNNIPFITASVPVGRKPTPAFEGVEEIPSYYEVNKLVAETYKPAYDEALAFLENEWDKHMGKGEYAPTTKLDSAGKAASPKKAEDLKADLEEAKKFVNELGDDDEDLPFDEE